LFVLDYSISEKGKDFAGDVGSISMALFLGFMIKTILETGQLGYILRFTVLMPLSPYLLG
jgi:hypothetical protein